MLAKTFLAVFALTPAVIAAPFPTETKQPSQSDVGTTIENLLGSPFGNGNGNGNDNQAGNDNDDNASGNGVGNGNKNGNGNIFGNDNGILSGNSGLKIGRNDKPSLGDMISGLVGSPFGNGNGNGNGNEAGVGNDGNAAGNGNENGNGNGNDNKFGNGNDILSGNDGISIGRRAQKVRARDDLPDGTFSLVPDQTLTSLNKVFSQLFTDGPEDLAVIVDGALAGKPIDSKFAADKQRRQILTGLEDIIAQELAGYIP